MQRTLTVVIAGMALVIGAAACSGGSSGSSSSTSTTAEQASPAATATSAAKAKSATTKSTTVAAKKSPAAAKPKTVAAKKPPAAAKPKTVAAVPAMASSATLAAGAKVFSTNCSSCHQAQGTGQPGVFPPLAKNPTVTGNPTRLAHIVKYGLSGSVVVAGTTYNGMMPAWHSTLSDADIAAVLSYVRSSWGNKAGPITAAQVAAVKQ